MHSGHHAGLVLPPLFLTMAFCFALVLVQQYQTNSRIAASKQQAYTRSHSKLSPTSLKTIEPLQPIAVSRPSAADPSSGIKTSAPPQPSKTSGAAVQGATQNSLPVGAVIDSVAAPVKQLLR